MSPGLSSVLGAGAAQSVRRAGQPLRCLVSFTSREPAAAAQAKPGRDLPNIERVFSSKFSAVISAITSFICRSSASARSRPAPGLCSLRSKTFAAEPSIRSFHRALPPQPTKLFAFGTCHATTIVDHRALELRRLVGTVTLPDIWRDDLLAERLKHLLMEHPAGRRLELERVSLTGKKG